MKVKITPDGTLYLEGTSKEISEVLQVHDDSPLEMAEDAIEQIRRDVREPGQIKEGDLVRVKTGIGREKYASKLGWSRCMDYMEGTVCEVKAVLECGTMVELKYPDSDIWTPYIFFIEDVEPVDS